MPVVYHPSIKTDTEKLYALYSLRYQMIQEHNAKLEVAKSLGVYPGYWKEFKTKLKPLLAEQNSLKEKIRNSLFTKDQWKKLSPDEMVQAETAMYGDKQLEQLKPTKATASFLDELKTIDLNGLPISETTDPYEDFTTFTEYDPNSQITVDSATKISVTAFQNDQDAWVVIDKGAAHFSGSFDFLLEVQLTSQSGGIWVLSSVANQIDSQYDIEAEGDSKLDFFLFGDDFYLRETDSGANYSDSYKNIASGTLFFCEFERDEDVGTYGTIYAYIRITSHAGALQDTLIVTLHTSKKDFEFYFATNSTQYGSAANTITGFTQKHDLQEAAGEEKGPVNAAVSVGVLPSASRALAIDRDSAVIVGALVTASRLEAIARSASVAVGNLVSASKIFGKVIASSVIVGIVSTASRILGKVTSSSVIVGIAASASRTLAIDRDSSVIVGVVSSASRLAGTIRSATTSIGVAVSASYETIGEYLVQAAVSIGVAVSSSRLMSVARSASVIVGNAVSVTKSKAVSRSSSVLIGIRVSARGFLTELYRKVKSFTGRAQTGFGLRFPLRFPIRFSGPARPGGESTSRDIEDTDNLREQGDFTGREMQ